MCLSLAVVRNMCPLDSRKRNFGPPPNVRTFKCSSSRPEMCESPGLANKHADIEAKGHICIIIAHLCIHVMVFD